MKKVILSLYLSITPLSATPLPSFSRPFCPVKLSASERETEKSRLVLHIHKASQKKYSEKGSLWDPAYLENNPDIVNALQEFRNKKRGQSLHHLKVQGKTALQLHQELIDKGFIWKEVPLVVDQGKQLYWKTDGSKTSNPTDPDITKMQIYSHLDGSMVRIKAGGVPDLYAKYPKRLAHVVIAVLRKFDPADCQQGKCDYDTSYENEAFKVTGEGFPNPKAASAKYGFLSSL